MHVSRASLALLFALGACSDDGPIHLDIPAVCNPLGGGACLAPWPPPVYLHPDASSPTGFRLAIPVGAVPPTGGGAAFDPTPLNGRSGYSPATQIVAHFGVAI